MQKSVRYTVHLHCNFTMKFTFIGHDEKVNAKNERTKLFVSFFQMAETLLEPKLWPPQHRKPNEHSAVKLL